jgi:hypothetical protein
LKGSQRDKKRAEFVKFLRALPFNEDLLKDTKFSEIRLAGQYLEVILVMEEEGEGGREGFRLHVEPQEADGQVHLHQINRQLYIFYFLLYSCVQRELCLTYRRS